MKPASEQWAVKDKKRLLLAMMEALAGDAHLSFEGDLSGFRLMQIADASDEETTILKRNTTWPKLDFVVVPLEPEIIAAVLPAIGGNVPKRILHIQIEKNGSLEFATYDSLPSRMHCFWPCHQPRLDRRAGVSGVMSITSSAG